MNLDPSPERANRATSPLAIAAAWVLVTVPLGWGVYRSVVTALPLFHGAPVATQAPAEK